MARAVLSSPGGRRLAVAAWLAFGGALALLAPLAGCSAPAGARADAAVAAAATPLPAASCEAEARLALPPAAQAARTAPFFELARSRSALRCVAYGAPRSDAPRWRVQWQFADGTVVAVSEDRRIEWIEHRIDLAAPLADARGVLAAAVDAVFGPKGCAIDWNDAETLRAESPPGATLRVYRGTVCQCSAAEVVDAQGRTIGLRLSRTC